MATITSCEVRYGQRRASLGRYNANRAEWNATYRLARTNARAGREPNSTIGGILWKAALIVAFERHAHNDPMTYSMVERLASKRLIDEIVNE